MSKLKLTVALYHIDCPSVRTRGAPPPPLKSQPVTTGENPVFMCLKCQTKVSVQVLTDVVER